MSPPTLQTLDIPAKEGSSSSVLMVALYLVLLAFFILLNALAFTDQQRSEEAIQSVNSSFKGQEEGVKLLTKVPKSLSMEIIIKRHYDDLRHMAEDYINAKELKVVQHGKALVVSFPSAALFQPDSTFIKDDKRAFLKHVSASVYPGIPGTRVEIQIIGSSRNYLEGDLEEESKLELLRIGTLARFLSVSSVPQEQIFTGMIPGKEKIITLRFEVVTPQGNRE